MAQLFNVGEHIQTNLGQDLLTGFLQQHSLQIGADQTDHQNAGVNANHGEQVAQLELFLDGILNMHHQQGGDQIVNDGEEHDEEDCHEVLPVGLAVAEQTGDNFFVGHMPLIVQQLVLGLFHGEIGKNEGDGKTADDGTDNDHGQIFHNKIKHCGRLLPLPASAGPPSCGSRGNCCKVPRGCRWR